MDEHLFIEALALCALGIGGGEDMKELTNFEKILLMVGQMNSSLGPDRVVNACGVPVQGKIDIIEPLRSAYPRFYGSS